MLGGARGLVVRYEYKEWGNMRCFRNPIVVSGFVLYNILYCMVESFSLIRGRMHGWPNHVKTSCTVFVIVYLCVLELTLLASKLSLAYQPVSELGLKISERVKDHKAHKMKTKGIFH